MNMIAKFDGRCRNCGGELKRGTVIDWTREGGATHTQGATCDAVKAAKRAAVTAPVESLDMSGVVAFLVAAKERSKANGHELKAPKVCFLHVQHDSCNGTIVEHQAEVRLSLAKATGANPGAVYVKVDGVYVGLVAADGSMRGSRDAGVGSLTVHAGLRATLRTIVENPAAAAKAYAALRGCCSFCSKGLEDQGSLEVGYGPKCAKNYGLPHKALGVIAAQQVEAAA